MLTELAISGFKSIGDVSVSLGLVNIFIGANGSGKSNFLEAIGMLGAIASGNLESESLHYRGVRLGSPSSFLTSLKNLTSAPISFAAEDSHTIYRAGVIPNQNILSKWDFLQEEIWHDGQIIVDRKSDGVLIYKQPEGYFAKYPYDPAARSDTRTNVSLSRIPMETLSDGRFLLHQVQDKEDNERRVRRIISFLDELASFAIFSPSTPQLRGFLDDVHRDPISLGGSGLGRAIEEMKSTDPKMLGPFDIDDVYELIDWADSLRIDAENDSRPYRLRIGDRYMDGSHSSVSLLEASEGALYVLFMLTLVGHERAPQMFAVDNFDQALHPRLACALTRLVSDQILADGSRQMLATTHNPLVLDGLDLLDDRVRLFTVDRDDSGATQIDRVLVTEELIEKGFSLSRLWTSGRLGGVPKNL